MVAFDPRSWEAEAEGWISVSVRPVLSTEKLQDSQATQGYLSLQGKEKKQWNQLWKCTQI